MTIEKAQADFDELIAKNGFVLASHTGDTRNPIYHRVWSKQKETLEIRIILSYGIPLVTVKRNGKVERGLIRDYSSPNRAMRAIREIVRCAGFEM